MISCLTQSTSYLYARDPWKSFLQGILANSSMLFSSVFPSLAGGWRSSMDSVVPFARKHLCCFLIPTSAIRYHFLSGWLHCLECVDFCGRHGVADFIQCVANDRTGNPVALLLWRRCSAASMQERTIIKVVNLNDRNLSMTFLNQLIQTSSLGPKNTQTISDHPHLRLGRTSLPTQPYQSA